MVRFKKGDLVRLKSGGPKMTVTDVGQAAYTQEDTVWVRWFDEKGKVENDTFSPESLEHAKSLFRKGGRMPVFPGFFT